MTAPKRRARPMWKGGPHDPSVIRGELGSRFLAALLADFAQKGARTIHQLRRERHQDYIKLIVALLPKEIRIREIEIPEMPDDEFEETFERLKKLAKMVGMEDEKWNTTSNEAVYSRDGS